jgi:hypothetical protein
MTEHFTVSSSLQRSSAILILQNLFPRDLKTHSISTNYITLFKNPKCNLTISHLAKRVFSMNPNFLIQAFEWRILSSKSCQKCQSSIDQITKINSCDATVQLQRRIGAVAQWSEIVNLAALTQIQFSFCTIDIYSMRKKICNWSAVGAVLLFFLIHRLPRVVLLLWILLFMILRKSLGGHVKGRDGLGDAAEVVQGCVGILETLTVTGSLGNTKYYHFHVIQRREFTQSTIIFSLRIGW